MKLAKAATVAGVAAAALALGAPAMAAGNPTFSKNTLHAVHTTVKQGSAIVLYGKVTGRFFKGEQFDAQLLWKGKDGKFHALRGPGTYVYMGKSTSYKFVVMAGVGKSTFEVNVNQAMFHKNHIVSNPVTVTIKK